MPIETPILAASVAVAGVGALYALHHLRIRPTRLTTATLLFWQQAVRPQQTKVPWSRRFSHRRTFALLSAIVLLGAAALVTDRWDAGAATAPRDVIVIDSGSAMADEASPGRTLLAAAADQAVADLGKLAGTPLLVSAGPVPTLTSGDAQPAALLRRALSSLAPQPGASAAASALRLADALQGDRPGRILWYTTQPKRPDGLPESVAARVELRPVAPAPAAAIVGVDYESSPADPARGTLRVTVAGTPRDGMAVRTPTAEQPVEFRDGRGTARFDVPAGTKQVALTLTGAPGNAAGHNVTYTVPDRRPLTFRFVGAVPDALKAALLACGTQADDGAIAVAPAGTPLPTDTQAAIVVDNASAAVAEAPLAVTDVTTLPVALEQAAVRNLPTAALPGTPLMTAAGVAVASLQTGDGVRTLHLSDALLADGADLPRRAAFPVLVGDWCDRLAGRLAAPAVVPWLRAAEDPLWAGLDGRTGVDRVVAVADRPLMPEAAVVAPLAAGPGVGHGFAWTQAALALALLLAVVEGLLHAARKIV